MDLILNESKIKRPALSDVLSYKNKDIIDKFCATYNCDYKSSEFIFNETKKLLWLFNESNFDKVETLSIDDSLIILDEMWHTFILFTNYYTSFCNNYFGYYLHHRPTSESEKNIYSEEIELLSKTELLQRRSNEKRPQYEYVYDKLGEETFVTWYVKLNKIFTVDGEKSIKSNT